MGCRPTRNPGFPMSVSEIKVGKAYVAEIIVRTAQSMDLEVRDLTWGGDPPVAVVWIAGKRQVYRPSEEDLEDAAADASVRSRLEGEIGQWLKSTQPPEQRIRF